MLLALQVLVIGALGQRKPGPFFSEIIQLILGILCILACIGTFQRTQGTARYPWRFLTITFATWTVGQSLAVYVDLSDAAWATTLSDILFFLSTVPFGMLPFLDLDNESNSFDKLQILDFVQVGIFWGSIYLRFSSRLWSPASGLVIGPFLWSRDISFDAVLIALLLLRAFLTRSKAAVSFFARMAVFLSLSGLADAYVLNPKHELPAGGWFDLIWTVLLVIPILIAETWKNEPVRHLTIRRSQHIAITQVFPLLYPLLSFLILAQVNRAYPVLAPAVFTVSFITLSARVLIIQYRHQRSQAQLLIDAQKRKRSEEALRQSEVQYRMLFETNPIPMWVFDRNSLKFLAVNTAAIRHYGYAREEFLSMTIADIRPAEDIAKLTRAISNPQTGLQERSTWRHQKKDGSIISVEIIGHDLQFRGNNAELIAAYDITQRQEAAQALFQAEEKYRALFEDAVVGMFQADAEGKPLSINRALAEIQGYDSPDEMISTVPNILAQLFEHAFQIEKLRNELELRGVVRNIEVEFCRRDGGKRSVVANIRAVRDAAGKTILLEGTIEDVTDRKRAEEQVHFLAYYDSLTGLPNRTLLRDRLKTALAGAKRRNEKVALLFLDLDRFKIINDSLGHSFGDLLLQEAAERLKRFARQQDTVSRIGGDEFVIVLTGVKDVHNVAAAAERIMDVLTADFIIQDRRLNVSCSMGISIYPDHGMDNETLIKNADAAMYCAKESGRCGFRFFTDEMNVEVTERLTVEHNLRLALEKQELFLVFQPQMDLSTGRIAGVEALLRWKHPELGIVPPQKFIRIAESSGLIFAIGEWVLQKACSVAHSWQQQGLGNIPVAVNVSAIQFRQEGFCAMVKRALDNSGLAPRFLELEVTETLLLSNADVTLPVLHELKRMGVTLAIDDFGTGYSSLSYLRHFPVNKLKIDRSFIKGVTQNTDDEAITAAIISLGRTLGLKVIAEGVETAAQVSFLHKHGCDEIQGYYFSKPVEDTEVASRLRIQTMDSSHPIAAGATSGN